MWEHWKEIIGFLTISGFFLGFFIGLYKYLVSRTRQARAEGKEEGKEEGSVSTQLCSHKKWIQGLEERLHVVETAEGGYMTHDGHESEAEKCKSDIDRRLDDNHDNLEKLAITFQKSEDRRQAYRDEDNRWKNKVTDSLARLETAMSQ